MELGTGDTSAWVLPSPGGAIARSAAIEKMSSFTSEYGSAPFGSRCRVTNSVQPTVLPILSDEELLIRARRGDRVAYGQVAHRHQDRLYNVLLRLVGESDEAAELGRETFARGLAKIEEYPDGVSAYTWLMRIAVNLAVSALRKGRRKRTFFSTEENTTGEESPSGGEAVSSNRSTLEALGRMETDYRAVLVLRDVEAMDDRQLSEVLGLAQAAVKSRLFRARLALRDELGAARKKT